MLHPLEAALLQSMSLEWKKISRGQIGVAQSLRKKGLLESRYVFPSSLGWRLTAQAMEARRAETQGGSVNDSAVHAPTTPEGDTK